MIKETMAAVTELSDGDFSFGDVTSVVDVGLSALGAFMDPAGALVGAVLGPLLDWVAANVSFVKEPLDLLLGDPPEIMDYGNAWTDAAKQLTEQGNRHVEMVRGELSQWTGPGHDAYLATSRNVNQTFQRTAQLAERMGQAVRFAGTVVGVLREVVWGMVKELVISLVTNAVIAAASAIPSFGSSLAAYTAWASGKVAIVMGKVSKGISKVFSKLSRLTRKIGPLSRMFARASQHFAQLAVKYGRQVGKINQAGNTAQTSADEAAAAAAEARRTANASAADPSNIDRSGEAVSAADRAREAQRQAGTDHGNLTDQKPDILGKDEYESGRDGVNKGNEVIGDDPGEIQDL